MDPYYRDPKIRYPEFSETPNPYRALSRNPRSTLIVTPLKELGTPNFSETPIWTAGVNNRQFEPRPRTTDHQSTIGGGGGGGALIFRIGLKGLLNIIIV